MKASVFTKWLGSLMCFAIYLNVCAFEPTPLALGSKAPDFRLPGVDGKEYGLVDFASYRHLAVIFTCNHCPTAQSYEDRLMALVKEYAPKGVGFVAISPNDPLAVRLDELGYTDLNDSLKEMKIRAATKGFNFPYLYDGETQETSKAYGAVATPHVFLFDEERRLVYTGRVDSTELRVTCETVHSARDAIESLLAGRPLVEPTTKVFGCSVKWADKRHLVDQFDERWAKKQVSLEWIDLDGVGNLMKNEGDRLKLVNVWATWCGPCVAEFPDLVEIQRMYGHRAFDLVTLSADSPKKHEGALVFLKKQQSATLNYHFDSDKIYDLIEKVDPKWEGALPYTVLVKPGGEIVYRVMGAFDPLEVKRAIVTHLGREKDW